ncbi:MAG: response regulator [Flavobacteriaceae bacterium]|nr:response regulator [Flavobacteriaceae bacterium]
MDQIKILVVEDEILIADSICDTLTCLGYSTLEPAINYTEAILSLEQELPHIAILDINLSGVKSGIDLAKLLNEKYQIPFIFLTSNADVETVDLAKKVKPQSYLVKPFTQEELFTTIEIALSNFSKSINKTQIETNNILDKNSLFVKENGMFIKVKFEEILYIKSDHVYVEIILTTEKKHVVRTSLNEILSRLTNEFIRIHRGYIVNYNHIDQMHSNKLLIDGEILPIGKKYKYDILQKIILN